MEWKYIPDSDNNKESMKWCGNCVKNCLGGAPDCFKNNWSEHVGRK